MSKYEANLLMMWLFYSVMHVGIARMLKWECSVEVMAIRTQAAVTYDFRSVWLKQISTSVMQGHVVRVVYTKHTSNTAL